MTEICADEFTAGLLERVMRSAGAAASLVPVIVEFTTEALRRSAAVLLLAYWVFQILFWATAPHYPEWLAFPWKLLWTLRLPLGALLWLTEKQT